MRVKTRGALQAAAAAAFLAFAPALWNGDESTPSDLPRIDIVMYVFSGLLHMHTYMRTYDTYLGR